MQELKLSRCKKLKIASMQALKLSTCKVFKKFKKSKVNETPEVFLSN